jgi:hypothetical protein
MHAFLDSHENQKKLSVTIKVVAVKRSGREMSPHMDGRNKLGDRDQNLHAIPLHKRPLNHADQSESSNKTRNS